MTTNGKPVDTGAVARRNVVPTCKITAGRPVRSRAAALAGRQRRGGGVGSRGNATGMAGRGVPEAGPERDEGAARVEGAS